MKERAFFSDSIDSPLISYGKLLKAGWSIESSGFDGPPILSHHSGTRVELAFRNNSLVISGDVRMVHAVRAINVDIPRSWQNLKKGWFETDDFQLCSSSATHFVDVTREALVLDWPYCTTLGLHDTRGWEVIELCEKIFDMQDHAAPVPGTYSRLLTILSKSILSVSDFGMIITDMPHDSPAAGASECLQPVEVEVEVPLQYEAEQRSGTEVEASSQPVPRSSVRPLPQTVAVETTDSITIAGVHVRKDSSIAVLKAACSYLQVSQSGSKTKLWNRILATLDKQAINAERELAAVALDKSQRVPVPVSLQSPPDEQSEIDAHCLTHLPYAAWCPSCVLGKGRPDQHRADPSRLQRREIPIISFDFCFTGKSLENVSENEQQSKLTALVVHDSYSGSVHCIPVIKQST